jgi:DNA-directed RNA polymerase specialized sigma24 family protein
MKEYYQPKGGKKGRHALRENTYRRVWYLIADYRYFKCIQAGLAEARCLSGGAVQQEESGSGMVAEEPAEYLQGVERFDLVQLGRYIKAIEDAQEMVPPAYRDYVMRHIIEKMKYKDMRGVSERTMKSWVQRFIWNVAHNLGEV